MRRARFFGIGFLFLVFVFVLGACSRESAPKSEEGAQVMLDQYPFYPKGAMTDKEIKRFGLVRQKLNAPLAVFNYYRGLGKNGGWQYEILPAGTEVAIDNNGRPWYKTDCSNRLYAPADTATTGSAVGGRRGFPWQLLLLPLAVLLVWFLLKKLSGADASGGHSSQSATPVLGHGFGFYHYDDEVIVPPKSDKSEPKPSVSPEFHEKNQSSVASSSLDNAGPIMPIIAPVVTTGKTANTEEEQEKTQKTTGDAAVAQAIQPVATTEAPADRIPTVGDAISTLSGHGFKRVCGIKELPDGGISFTAVVRGKKKEN